MKPHPETIALARLAGARVVRILVPFGRVTGAAIISAAGAALVRMTADGTNRQTRDGMPIACYAFTDKGAPADGLLTPDVRILVWCTEENPKP